MRMHIKKITYGIVVMYVEFSLMRRVVGVGMKVANHSIGVNFILLIVVILCMYPFWHIHHSTYPYTHTHTQILVYDINCGARDACMVECTPINVL